jgi:hypothetical protein
VILALIEARQQEASLSYLTAGATKSSAKSAFLTAECSQRIKPPIKP